MIRSDRFIELRAVKERPWGRFLLLADSKLLTRDARGGEDPHKAARRSGPSSSSRACGFQSPVSVYQADSTRAEFGAFATDNATNQAAVGLFLSTRSGHKHGRESADSGRAARLHRSSQAHGPAYPVAMR